MKFRHLEPPHNAYQIHDTGNVKTSNIHEYHIADAASNNEKELSAHEALENLGQVINYPPPPTQAYYGE